MLDFKVMLSLIAISVGFCSHGSCQEKSKRKYKLKFNTQYQQFYIADKRVEQGDTGSGFWADSVQLSRLATADGILGVLTGSYGHIRGDLTILDAPIVNPILANYDHIVEAGIELRSGVLQILDCPTSTVIKEIKVRPGIYRVRVYSSNLGSNYIDTIEDDIDDYYKIEIWPDSTMEKKVLKQYTGH